MTDQPIETQALVSAALVAAQGELEPATFDSQNPFLKNKYASLGSVIHQSRPILAKHGLAILQVPTTSDGKVSLSTTIIHSSGQKLDGGTISLPMGDERGKSLAQVAGSIITYLRRYAWSSVLGMYADEDTDGNAPPDPKKGTPKGRPPAHETPPGTTEEPEGSFDTAQLSKTPPSAVSDTTKGTLATSKTRSWALHKLGADVVGPRRNCLEAYMKALQWIKEGETVEAWPLEHVPTNGADLQKLLLRIGEFEADQRAKEP